MCGILGQIQTSDPVDLNDFERRLGTLAHRGPDGRGVQILDRGRGALGHRRLSIVDLSPSGHQPMANEDRSLWLTFNGEIYNHRALRQELEQRGHRFASTCDAEVILHAYEQWGWSAVRRLDGIFAFGLWDERTQTLVLARDPMGVKPLYVCESKDAFSFASEPRALLGDHGTDRRIDPAAFRDYLAYGYVTGERSIYQGIRRLLPGDCLVMTAGRKVTHAAGVSFPTMRRMKFDAAVDAVQHRLAASIQQQQMADVPVGLYLSGGLDSAAVSSEASRQVAAGSMQAYTVGFDDPQRDERPLASRLAKRLNLSHVTTTLEAHRSLEGLLEQWIEAFDEPFGGTASMTSCAVAELALAHQTKVVLAGDGGDELFAGYTRYEHYQARRRTGWRRWVGPMVGRGRGHDPVAAYFMSAGRMPWGAQSSWLGRKVLGHVEPDVLGPLKRHYRKDLSPIAAARWMDLHVYLPDHILLKVDRASMHHGIEARVPLLDRALVELCFALPSRLHRHDGHGKAVLRGVLERHHGLQDVRRPKRGFGLPLLPWMAQGLARGWRSFLTGGVLAGRGMIDAEAAVGALEANPLWRWTVLAGEIWARRWLEQMEAGQILSALSQTRSSRRRQPAAGRLDTAMSGAAGR